MIRILLILLMSLAGCCSEKSSTLKEFSADNSEFNETAVINDSSESEEVELKDSELAEYTPRTLDEKWLDFKKRSKFSQPENLLYFAEELYDAFEPNHNIRRMELSFFIAQRQLTFQNL